MAQAPTVGVQTGGSRKLRFNCFPFFKISLPLCSEPRLFLPPPFLSVNRTGFKSMFIAILSSLLRNCSAAAAARRQGNLLAADLQADIFIATSELRRVVGERRSEAGSPTRPRPEPCCSSAERPRVRLPRSQTAGAGVLHLSHNSEKSPVMWSDNRSGISNTRTHARVCKLLVCELNNPVTCLTSSVPDWLREVWGVGVGACGPEQGPCSDYITSAAGAGGRTSAQKRELEKEEGYGGLRGRKRK